MAADGAGASDVQAVAPVCVDLAALLRRPGNRRPVEVDIRPAGLSTSTATVDRLHGTVVAESMGEKVSVTGTLQMTWSGPCRRCLEPARESIAIDLMEIFELRPVEGETYALPTEEQLDLAPMLIEQALLSLPLAPLCNGECRGPAPDAYPAEVAVEAQDADGADAAGDPRWAVLDQLRFDDD